MLVDLFLQHLFCIKIFCITIVSVTSTVCVHLFLIAKKQYKRRNKCAKFFDAKNVDAKFLVAKKRRQK